MKIQAINSFIPNNQVHTIQSKTNCKNNSTLDSFHASSVSKAVTYSPISIQSKGYGERVYSYLDNIGYFDDMSQAEKTNYKQEILANVYTFQEEDVKHAVVKLSDSLAYLRNIADSIDNPKNKQDFIHFIRDYFNETISKINEYFAQLKMDAKEKKDQENFNKLKEKENEMVMLKEMAENSKEQCEAMEEGFDVISKCFQIAMRIQKGDIVPQSDHQFLMENNPDLYEMAMTMREFNEDPEEHDSILEDEDKEHMQEVTTGHPSLETIVSEMEIESK